MEEKTKPRFGEGLTAAKFQELQAAKGKHSNWNQRANKYNAQKVAYNGVMYDSKLEAALARKLDLLKNAPGKEKVVTIDRQVVFSFDLNGVHICKYIPDFKVTYADGRIEYMDAKGMELREFSLKKKMLKAFYGIDVIVVKSV